MKIPGEIKVIIILIICVSLFASLFWYSRLDDERIEVEGIIVDVELYESNVLAYDVLRITFDNGDSYLIINDMGTDVDFTVNSKFIIKLFRDSKDSYWEIDQIYRIP